MVNICRIVNSITNKIRGVPMANKNKTITVRLGAFEEQKLSQDIEASGFSKGRDKSKNQSVKGIRKPNTSDYIRWLIRHGVKPISRKHYSQILKVNMNLTRVGGLLNQFLYHSNKERKIMNDNDLYDENNKAFLNRLNHLEKVIFEISDDLKLIKSIMHETAKLEGIQ